CTLSCTLPLRVAIIPNKCTLSTVNHSTGSLFSANDWSLVVSRCRKETTQVQPDCPPAQTKGKRPTNIFRFGDPDKCIITISTPTECPALGWSTTITSASFNPTITPAMLNPMSNFSTQDSPEQTGTISAQSLNPIAPISCSLGVRVGLIGPDYQANAKVGKLIFNLGEQFPVNATITNIGNVKPNSKSLTRLSGNCTLQEVVTPALAPDESFSHTFSCTCFTPGYNSIYVTADANDEITEINEKNNKATIVVFCGALSAPVCADFV
ncbi:MAG: hypothetical protein N3G22_03385, partial [Candidatus Micrarchaeota archaeon]|nr:hypothetical protein [Candidatus Micrarchaeota archaeon]